MSSLLGTCGFEKMIKYNENIENLKHFKQTFELFPYFYSTSSFQDDITV